MADKESVQLRLADLAQTRAFGYHIGTVAQAGDIILLSGDLGAGKTTLTQAIARGLQVPAGCYITSPTFSLLHEYPGRIPLYHMDLYRLAGEEEIEELGFEEYIYGQGLTVIEWPERLGDLTPRSCLEIELLSPTPQSREIILTGRGAMSCRLKDFSNFHGAPQTPI
ncbi:MAG: tRNA (adenosine(37)-N6)-threonylcarbamoyltransferase complex ATPase subunit type 1 TsaE [Desulfurivibrionaceae bacterium]|nr:tRNA (adenosine(37)-N6)-threonylcarbamoyltransferase complex ATPase subunit type 1 TsaE [Desulfurivibrionaceae bacterium]